MKTVWTVLYALGWLIVARLMLLSLALLSVFAPMSAYASDIIGQETVGEFRGWGETLQIGYVAGARAFAAFLDVRCTAVAITAEYVAALKWNKSHLPDSMLLTEAMARLMHRDGCKVHDKPANGKPGMQS